MTQRVQHISYKSNSLIFQELERLSAEENVPTQKKIIPNSNYKDKYKHLIGDEAAKKGAKQTTANRSYGFGELSELPYNK